MIDGLVMARAALSVGIAAPRKHVAPAVRHQLETVTNAAEQIFSRMCELLRATPAFDGIGPCEREAIEKELIGASALFSDRE